VAPTPFPTPATRRRRYVYPTPSPTPATRRRWYVYPTPRPTTATRRRRYISPTPSPTPARDNCLFWIFCSSPTPSPTPSPTWLTRRRRYVAPTPFPTPATRRRRYVYPTPSPTPATRRRRYVYPTPRPTTATRRRRKGPAYPTPGPSTATRRRQYVSPTPPPTSPKKFNGHSASPTKAQCDDLKRGCDAKSVADLAGLPKGGRRSKLNLAISAVCGYRAEICSGHDTSCEAGRSACTAGDLACVTGRFVGPWGVLGCAAVTLSCLTPYAEKAICGAADLVQRRRRRRTPSPTQHPTRDVRRRRRRRRTPAKEENASTGHDPVSKLVEFADMPTSQYTGAVKKTFEVGFGINIGIYDTGKSQFKAGSLVRSSLSGRRSMAIRFEALIQGLNSTEASKVEQASAQLTGPLLAQGIARAKVVLGPMSETVNLPNAAAITVRKTAHVRHGASGGVTSAVASFGLMGLAVAMGIRHLELSLT